MQHWIYDKLDRITNLQLLESQAVPLQSLKAFKNEINYRALASGMSFLQTEADERVEFLVVHGIIDEFIDRFGTDLSMIPEMNGTHTFRISVMTSPTAAVRFAIDYGAFVKIVSPPLLRQTVRRTLAGTLRKYRTKSAE